MPNPVSLAPHHHKTSLPRTRPADRLLLEAINSTHQLRISPLGRLPSRPHRACPSVLAIQPTITLGKVRQASPVGMDRQWKSLWPELHGSQRVTISMH